MGNARTYESICAAFPAPPEYAFLCAARAGDLAAVMALHAAGVDIRTDNDSAVGVAAANGHLAVVEYLCAQGANIRVNKNYAVRIAAQKGHLVIVEYLHAQGADIHADNDSAMRAAAQHGHLAIVKYLHAQGADIRTDSDYAVRMAAENGHLAVLEYLHTEGADIRVHNDCAVSVAARKGHLAVVKYLHSHGADIHADNDYAVCGAAGEGHLTAVKYLHEQGADIRVRNDSALCWAAGSGHLAVVEYLHGRGADIHADKDSAVRRAAAGGHLAVVKYLHDHGPDIRLNKDSALRHAAARGHLTVVEYLLDHGADIHASDDFSLCLAADRGHLAVVEYLHGHGADIRAQDDYAIRWAAGKCHWAVVDYLARQSVPVNCLPEVQQRHLEGWRAWRKRHGHCPEGLQALSPHYFRPEAFDDVVKILATEGYTDGAAHKYAYHATGLFGTTDRVLQYLQKWGAAGKQPLHDIIQHIKLPQAGRYHMASWADAALRHGPKMARLVKFAGDNIPVPEKDSKGQWSYTRTREVVARNAYARGAENPELAAQCFQQDWDNDDFERALALVAQYREKYGVNDNRKPGFAIPDISIEGAMFGKAGYRFYKLPDGDVRGLLLGEFTNCCQHIGGVGAVCAEHGFMSRHSGFYVVEDEKSHEIVAQSWAWRGTKDELVLDSLESLRGHMQAVQWRSLCDEFARRAVADEAAHVSAVHVGKGGATPDIGYAETIPATPRKYDGYRDSKKQFKIAVK